EAVPGSSPARPDVATAPSPTEPLDRHALELVDAPALGLARPGLSPAGGLVVTDDGAGVSAALVTELQRRGIEATLVHAVPADAAAVVFMGGLRAVADEAAAVAVMREAFTTARTVAPGFTERGGLFVTVQDTGGGFGLEPCPHERCFLAGLPALVKTAAIEWPTAHTAAIDLQCGGRSPDAIAEALAEELLHGGTCQEIAIMADGRRRTLHSSLAPRTDTTARPDAIGKGEVVVVSGGARGVTAACIMEWARRSQASFVLLGRSPLDDEHPALAGIEDPAALSRALLEQSRQQGETLRPVDLSRRAAAVTAAREVRATLAAIAEAGGQARYVRVDVTDAQAVTTALEEVRGEWGPIAAVVHGAGVLADKRIAQLQDDAFDRVVSTKVTGIQALLQATASDPLRVLCLFSSVAARSGNQGQVAYAMANEVLDKVAQAQARRRPTATVTALCWGPWAGGMVDASLRGHFAQRGIALIELDQGAKMFADEVQARPSAGPQHVELVIGASPDPGALTGLHQDTQSREFELHLHPQSHRWLLDHRVADVVVVPVAAAMEWFARAACGLCPRLHLQRIADLKVLRPLALSTFATAGARLTLRAYAHDGRNGDGTVVGLELLDAAGVVCYRAQATMAARSATLDAAPGQSPGPLRPLTDAELYDGRAMFHGPAFHLIEQLDGVADDGIVGTVQGVATVQATATMGWTAEPWRLDLAAIDGGLQLGVLWGRERLGGAVLPMGVSTIECSASTVATGPVHVVVHVLRSTRAQATADITLRDQQGSPIVVMRGVTFVLRPDRPPARVTTTRPRAQA
ncbi:MAG: SDR family oxidoreductase, partial [Deltaproteobacteria bacterium]|nr:SDR family oxidoreductase [Deltaproteobacteria bacterium]